jgi:hypothetical protein
MTPKLKARELVLTVLNIENSQGWNIRAFETHQLKELHEAIELADFGRGSKELNKIRIRVMGELLIRGEIQNV